MIKVKVRGALWRSKYIETQSVNNGTVCLQRAAQTSAQKVSSICQRCGEWSGLRAAPTLPSWEKKIPSGGSDCKLWLMQHVFLLGFSTCVDVWRVFFYLSYFQVICLTARVSLSCTYGTSNSAGFVPHAALQTVSVIPNPSLLYVCAPGDGPG